jgi:hypothetical protein
MSKQRLHTLLSAARAELSAVAPIIAAAEELRDACDWHDHATCEAEADKACELVDTTIAALCAAVDARRAGAPAPTQEAGDHLLTGFVPDAPAQESEEVAEFLAYEWPGDEVEA